MCVVDVKECVQTCKRTGHKLPLSVAEEARGNYDNNGVRNTSPGNTRERLTNGCEEIEDRVSKEDPDISPPVVVADVQRHEELVADLVLAVSARGSGIHVVDVSTETGDEFDRPLLAGLAGRRVKLDELVGLALDHQTTACRGQ